MEYDSIPADEYAKEARVGDIIVTQEYGAWPGGRARVIEITPDPQCPEIVIQVQGIEGQGEIGVFDHERVMVLERRTK